MKEAYKVEKHAESLETGKGRKSVLFHLYVTD